MNIPNKAPFGIGLDKTPKPFCQKFGANYKGKGVGTLRKIGEADLNELRKIFIETGAIERFETIEKQCNDTGR